MAERKNYKTAQKQQVIKYIQKHAGEHFTVAQFTQLLNKNGVAIGSTTVYRHLEDLYKKGEAQKYKLENNTCYQYIPLENKCTTHFHLKCTCCGALDHLDCDFLDSIQKHLLANHSFSLDTLQTVFYGKCKNCIATQNNTMEANL